MGMKLGNVLIALMSVLIGCHAQEATPSPEPYYGTYVGSLPDPSNIGVKGDVYIVNMTTFQVIGFKYSGGASGLYFWLDKSDSLTEDGYKIITFEFGDQPLKQIEKDRIVLWASADANANVNAYQTIGLWSESQKNGYSSLAIPKSLSIPSIQFLTEELRPTEGGRRYQVYSGPIMIMDRRRLKIFGFTFNGDVAPTTHFYVGRGLIPKMNHGKSVPIRDHQSPNYVPAITGMYTGDQDIILELPEDFDIYRIDWLSVFCTRFNLDLGHVKIGSDISPMIPPYVPLQKKHDQKEPPPKPSWPLNILSGKFRRQFTFQLGPRGLDRSYGKWARAEPAKWLWYVNGYMTPQIWLQRGITYTFTVEGGDRSNEYGQVNALYFTNTSVGGYGSQADYEKEGATIFAGLKYGKPLNEPTARSFGRNCTWIPRDTTVANPEMYDSFLAFKKNLRLKCEEGKTGGTFQWTPTKTTPATLYYQSYATPHMGFEMMVVDEVPSDLADGPDQHLEANYLPTSTEEAGETESTENEDISIESPGEDGRGGTRRESSPAAGDDSSSRYNGDSNNNGRGFKNGSNCSKLSSVSFHLAFTAFLWFSFPFLIMTR